MTRLSELEAANDNLRRKLDEANAGWTRVCADHGADHAARQRLERDLASAVGALREIGVKAQQRDDCESSHDLYDLLSAIGAFAIASTDGDNALASQPVAQPTPAPDELERPSKCARCPLNDGSECGEADQCAADIAEHALVAERARMVP
jgi:hypothetical protein